MSYVGFRWLSLIFVCCKVEAVRAIWVLPFCIPLWSRGRTSRRSSVTHKMVSQSDFFGFSTNKQTTHRTQHTTFPLHHNISYFESSHPQRKNEKSDTITRTAKKIAAASTTRKNKVELQLSYRPPVAREKTNGMF